ncbi:VTT domain-containing protein [Salinisphaera sp. Q1T1-3]|uniref:VTT domain-containing protein n=1 Tax=Salinisphaera sp. Q1T1-3 TaxID=2321229 RepID=UPI000E75103E|nr:VTT domain-containing protein [Salinisphaera sp. Q1T1-3]RJS94347.1 hypothetical protein D3260_04370 [Salinisphaera sp. Q1T1-3]
MAHALIADILAWVGAHPGPAIAVVFAIAVAESIFLFGLLIPGAIFMFAFGALVGTDALSGTAVFAAAILGTLIGDSTSYALGRRYMGRLSELPGLARVPGGVARGEAFFARHGGKGIVLGRLIGALRPVMPTIAGAAGLSIPRFVIMDVIATAVWAPIYIGPGVVFGASLDLAAQVATRLAILLIGAAAVVWVLTSLARFALVAGRSAGRRYADALMAWSARHRRLGLLGPGLADPRQPEIPALAVAATLLMLITGAIYLALWGLGPARYPTTFDAVVFYLVGGLHNQPTDQIARVLAELGSPIVYLPFAAIMGGLLVGLGNWRAATHWAVALLFSASATLLLRWLLAISPPAIFFHGIAADPVSLAGGGQDLILAATVYGLTGMIAGAGQPEYRRPYVYSGTVAAIVMIALARLYLGLDWASDSLIGLGVAFVWINLLTLGYRRQHPRKVRSGPLAGMAGVFFIAAAIMALWPGSAMRRVPGLAAQAADTRHIADWRTDGYRDLPVRIQTLRGRDGAPINIQAAGDHDALVDALTVAGWQEPPGLGFAQALTSLAPDTPIDRLAVWPRIHDGRMAGIVRVHAVAGTGRRWVVRLWPTTTVTGPHDSPVWIGIVDAQRVDHELRLVTTARDTAGYSQAADYLARSLAGHDIAHLWPAGQGRPPLLFWAAPLSSDAKVAPR